MCTRLTIAFLLILAQPGQSHEPDPTAVPNDRIQDVVRDAFLATHDGWSSDEVLLQKELNEKFLAACQKAMSDKSQKDFNWTLLNLRKAGKLGVKATKRRRDQPDAYRHLAEIAARTVLDKHQVSIDRIMCNPAMRADFDAQAALLAKGIDPYLIGKAAFTLRKTRKLKPELILRIADWSRKVSVHHVVDLMKNKETLPKTPGIYIFRDQTGYLYIGESINIHDRLKQHLDDSDRKSLSNYFREQKIENITVEIHAFPKDSRARKVSVRRAYESELIASRKPRFNVRP